MNNHRLEKDEVTLFEGLIKDAEHKSKVKFTLTSKKMIFEKEKGLFKKKFKVTDIVLLEHIKIYKEKVQVKRKKSNIMIQTIKKNITLSCSNALEASIITEKIITLTNGFNILERSSRKFTKAVNKIPKNFFKVGIKTLVVVGGLKKSPAFLKKIVITLKNFKII